MKNTCLFQILILPLLCFSLGVYGQTAENQQISDRELDQYLQVEMSKLEKVQENQRLLMEAIHEEGLEISEFIEWFQNRESKDNAQGTQSRNQSFLNVANLYDELERKAEEISEQLIDEAGLSQERYQIIDNRIQTDAKLRNKVLEKSRLLMQQ